MVSRAVEAHAVNRCAVFGVQGTWREIRAAAMSAAVENATANFEDTVMRTKNLLLATLVAATFGTLGTMAGSAAARTSVDIELNFAPPPVRYEAPPVAVRRGYVWQPGYWAWRGGRHVWVRGYWVRERPGYYWHPHRWVEVQGRWVYRPGVWSRDRDHDGVPDRYDRRPGDPTRR